MCLSLCHVVWVWHLPDIGGLTKAERIHTKASYQSIPYFSWGLQGIHHHKGFEKPYLLKIEYHAFGDTWWQPLLSYGKLCTELKIGSLI